MALNLGQALAKLAGAKTKPKATRRKKPLRMRPTYDELVKEVHHLRKRIAKLKLEIANDQAD